MLSFYGGFFFHCILTRSGENTNTPSFFSLQEPDARACGRPQRPWQHNVARVHVQRDQRPLRHQHDGGRSAGVPAARLLLLEFVHEIRAGRCSDSTRDQER